MKAPRQRHRWNLTPTQAIALQKKLAEGVLHVPLASPPRLVAGADAAFTLDGTRLIAGWVVWDLSEAKVVEQAMATRPLTFPYVPGLLSFREAPALLAAARKLRTEPDVLMLDGQGLAHPRRFGLACHVGILLDRPTLGCAKSLLCGEHAEPGLRVGSARPILHNGETVGVALRTQRGVKPVYISVGHRITLEDAVRVALDCGTRYRLPEPTRLAHQLVTAARR